MQSVRSKWILAAGAVVLGLGVLAGCAGKTKTEAQGEVKTGAQAPGSPAPAASTKLPDGLFVDKAPDGAVDVSKAVSAAKEGETVVVRGRIGGKREPFVEGRAIFTMGDMVLTPCNERPGDECKWPWDFCCEDGKGKVASVQIADADGMVLKRNIEGEHAVLPLSTVVVEGKVAPGSDGTNLVINATHIFVEKKGMARSAN